MGAGWAIFVESAALRLRCIALSVYYVIAALRYRCASLIHVRLTVLPEVTLGCSDLL